MTDTACIYIPIQNAAQQLGLPRAWLRDECESGRLPCLRAGRRLLIPIVEVKRELAARARGEGRNAPVSVTPLCSTLRESASDPHELDAIDARQDRGGAA